MNVLFISPWLDTRPNGARQLARAHYAALSNLCEVYAISVMTDRRYTAENTGSKTFLRGTSGKLETLRNMLTGHTSIYGVRAEREVMKIIAANHFDAVWLDDRNFGSTARKIKRTWPSLPVFAFYHGVREAEINTKNLLHNYQNMLGALIRLRQEKISARYADANIVLNERDAELLNKHYGVNADMLLPICFVDTAHIKHIPADNNKFNLLFVGSTFAPNVDGIKWFAKNVMPFLDERAVLHIVGRDMDSLIGLPEFSSDRIKISGYVENLDDCYNSADLVIAPIRYGWGMKTKTVEAMMYGKNFLGTSEALEGYADLNDMKCDSAEEFITRINGLISSGCERYNPEMRKLYEDKYSIRAMENMLRGLLGKVMKNS